ncbi:TMEM175 family protein [Microbacterium gorillae]|uniref:TMEM175 family protein n=1 Tax=Microbacterium gorillae TaxID=1231063 RepID=UPI001E578EB6|nr:TMEM175 family protein [Microbacterium gorillae]
MSESQTPPTVMEIGQSAERFKAFVDAVVAIAMTLLILPLMESVAEARHLSTAEYLNDHAGQIISFLLSFSLIATFWLMHHRVYNGVERITSRLMVINLAWLLTIVWLPVATAMLGQMSTDRLQVVLYVGSLVLTSALMLAMRVYLLRHPEMRAAADDAVVMGISIDLAMITCFGITFIASLIWPGPGYYVFFICMLTGFLARGYRRLLERRVTTAHVAPEPSE